MFYLLIILCLIPAVATAADPWSRRDVALQATYFLFHALDWGQTRQIARAPDRYWEACNPLLGSHPSQGRVDAYFTLSTLAHAGITHLLPSRYRPYWQGITIGVSGYCVGRNLSIGLGVRW